MADGALPRIAITVGDPAGIGPEIALEAVRDGAVRRMCRPILVADPRVLERHAQACGIAVTLRPIDATGGAVWSDEAVDVLAVPMADGAEFEFGAIGAACGRASIDCARRAIRAALAGEVEAVVAAPQNERSIHAAGIAFDGHPSFLARETGTAVDDVHLMLCFDDMRIAHATLHVSVREALALITRERVARVIRVTAAALERLGIARPRIHVGGLNPHAGEDGLFGREEIEIIAPAIADAREQGIDASGPFGADTMFLARDCDAYVVMLHDQGHIAAKLLAFDRTAALSIGSPILFSSVAHGSAHAIAGKGVADAGAMIAAITRLAKIRASPSHGRARPGHPA